MNTTIRTIWWTGIVGALVATLAILKEIALVLQALKDIQRLAEITREAAEGVADNVAAASKLAGAAEPARELREGTAALASTARSLEHKLAGPDAGSTPRGA